MPKQKQSFWLVLCLLGCLIAVPAHSEAHKRYVVVGLDLPALENEVGRQGGVVDHELVYHHGFVANMSERAIEQLRSLFGDDVFVEEDGEVYAVGDVNSSGRRNSTPSQPAQSVPWGITAVHARDANAITQGAGAVVCVVDTGIQSDHPDLLGNVVGGENFVAQRGAVDSTAWADDNGHGTHVAGTIAALDNSIGVVGVAPQVHLFAAKVLDKRGSGYMSDVAEGILSCLANHADVISMSLGSSSDSTLVHNAVIDAANAGLILVAAAGNESSGVSYPAKYDEVLAVSAVDSNSNLASFSNTGPEVDFAGPGVSVLSTTKGSSYATYSGTSMATPHVSGVAALMVAAGKSQLLASDIGLSSEKQGAGLIDALATVQ